MKYKIFKKILIFTFIALISDRLYALKIYRPANSKDLNDIPCYLKIENEKGEDVTNTAATVYYSYVDQPNTLYKYRKSYYLTGAMIMTLYLKPGKYRFSFYTPIDKQFEPHKKNFVWESNYFYYNTENPLNVMFLSPVVNDNGFYIGEWYLDYKAPKYYQFTKPYIRKDD